MIEFTTGDILRSEAEALVNTVNCEGFMGKGIAYQFKLEYPENFEHYAEACRSGILKPGTLLTTPEDGRLIINFPTKDKWRAKSKYDYIEQGLVALVDLILLEDIKSIAIPPLGCGNGGLDWLRVRPMITTTLQRVENDRTILVYEPSPNAIYKSTTKVLPKLKPSHLVLMELKLELQRFNKLRLQKASFLMNLILGEDYFKFDGHIYGPYAHSIEILSREIKAYQDYFGFSTLEAQQHALRTLTSEKLEKRLPRLRSAAKLASEIVNSLESDQDLELLTTILFSIRKEGSMTKAEVVESVHSWSERKASMFDESSIEKALETLHQKNLVNQNLYGFDLAH